MDEGGVVGTLFRMIHLVSSLLFLAAEHDALTLRRRGRCHAREGLGRRAHPHLVPVLVLACLRARRVALVCPSRQIELQKDYFLIKIFHI